MRRVRIKNLIISQEWMEFLQDPRNVEAIPTIAPFLNQSMVLLRSFEEMLRASEKPQPYMRKCWEFEAAIEWPNRKHFRSWTTTTASSSQ
jgi:hypothetical protein